MKLTLTQENFSKALNACGRVASSKAGLPVLANILIRTEKNRVIVAATNLEIAVTTTISAKVTEQGQITVPARLISDFVSNLPKETVEIETKGAHTTITCGGYTSTLNGIVADEFPELPTIDEKKSIHYSVQVGDFKQVAAQTLFATSNDPTRPVLTGVYWHSHEGYLYLVGTDGYRLSERRLIETSSTLAAVVPATTIQEVLRVTDDSAQTVDVLFDETQVRFRAGDSEVTSRLIDGNYPDYRKLIPATSETVATVATSDLTRTAKIAGLFARQVGGSITMAADQDGKQLAIRSVASEVGENLSTIAGDITGNGSVALNSRYLSDALGAFEADQITLSYSGKLAPILLSTQDKDANFTHIIMPLKS